LNVGFLAKQVLGISRSQIEIEKNVQLGCYFDNMKHYCLQVQILNRIIIIINNWSDDHYTKMRLISF